MSPSSDFKHIRKAFLTSLNEGVIELHRDWRAARVPPISMEGRLHGSLSLHHLPASDYAMDSGYYVDEEGQVVFVFFPDQYPKIEYKGSSVYVAGSFNGWLDAIGRSEWELTPERVGGRRALALRKSVDIFSCDEGCQFKFVTDKRHWFQVLKSAPNAAQDPAGNLNHVFTPKVTGKHRIGFTLKEPVDLSENNYIVYHTRKDVERVCLQPGDFFLNLRSDKELGAIVAHGATTFRLFAPRAKWVKVGFFKDLEKPESISWILMRRGVDFVWEATVNDDLSGWYYWYRLDGPENEYSHFDPWFKILDPYAKAAVGREGPGIIAAWPERRDGRPFRTPQWQDLIVLEGHVRDLVVNTPYGRAAADDNRALGFRDLTEYVRSEGFYPKLLGVNAIELQPIQENDSASYGEYHWGYMTCNFFAPHSGYARRPEKGSQVQEFAELVDALHAEGFAVIVDVVYNHVGEPAHLMYVDKLYYFHVGADGSLSNWSGCGNDLRSEAPMARRLIIESLKRLVEYFGVDGFRFDLADLVGKPVLREIEEELKKSRPDIILIAEPWSFRGHIGTELRDTGYASWNDGYRDYLKRFTRGEAGMEATRYFLKGSPIYYANWPAQTVNYVESHDDRVWIDDITENPGFDGTTPTPNDIARTRLMVAMLMMSVGIPMLHAGMDFMGTKGGFRNTYQDGARNALDYRRALRYPGVARYFAEWVAFRKSEKGSLVRHFTRAPESFFDFIEASNGLSFACVYNAGGEWGPRKLLFAANPVLDELELELGEWAKLEWRQIADHEAFIEDGRRAWSNAPDKRLFLPKLAAGLWEAE